MSVNCDAEHFTGVIASKPRHLSLWSELWSPVQPWRWRTTAFKQPPRQICFNQPVIWWTKPSVVAKLETLEKCIAPPYLIWVRFADTSTLQIANAPILTSCLAVRNYRRIKHWRSAVNSELPSLHTVICNHIRNGPAYWRVNSVSMAGA